MHRDHREIKKMEYGFSTWFRGQGGFTAYQVPLFGARRSCTVVQPERVIQACMKDLPDWDRDFVTAQVKKAQQSYPGVRVFEDSALAK